MHVHFRNIVLSVLLCSVTNIFGAVTKKEKIEQRVDSILRLMTLKEKIAQMNQISSYDAPTGVLSGFVSIDDRVKAGQIGTVLNIDGVERTRQLQQIAVENSRLSLPLIFALDVIHGYKTIFPVPLAESCSWNMEMIEQSARMAASEATASGLQWTFAPMVDIARDPRWGRVMEGSGEDPYLGSAIAGARVKGFQGDDLSANNTMLACAKHFVGYGASEGGRDYNTVDISEQRLRELYFPPFKAAADAGVATFMNSFNELMGIPATGNSFLIREVLKGEWNFQGGVVSDWDSVAEMIPHGVAADQREAALLAVKAGCDMDMEGNCYSSSLEELVKEGLVSESLVDDAVRRVLRLKFWLGLFDDPYRYCNPQREKNEILTTRNREIAREIAVRSIVLLENREELLPLGKQYKNIALIGPLADSQKDMLGEWCAKGDAKDAVSILQGMKRAAGTNYKIRYAKGCAVDDNDQSGFSEAMETAKNSDVVILCMGESKEMSGEAYCRTRLTLPGVQRELIAEMKKIGNPLILVLSNGRPLVLDWEKENIGTIVETWFLGTEAGNAIADVLFGKYNPSGKLTMSFPHNEGQIPVYYNYKATGRPFEQDIRYVTRYIDCPNTPLYPFGYGLSYTRFKYGDLCLDKKEIDRHGNIQVSVELKNTGNYDGEETVQLYIRDLKARVTRPVKELKGFRKIYLKKGETADVSFNLTIKDLEYMMPGGETVSDPGEFEVFVGGNSDNVKSTSFVLKE